MLMHFAFKWNIEMELWSSLSQMAGLPAVTSFIKCFPSKVSPASPYPREKASGQTAPCEQRERDFL
jgi:hypothetical protein